MTTLAQVRGLKMYGALAAPHTNIAKGSTTPRRQSRIVLVMATIAVLCLGAAVLSKLSRESFGLQNTKVSNFTNQSIDLFSNGTLGVSDNEKHGANWCPASMPHRYPGNNRCFERVWGGNMCNVDPHRDPYPRQRGDRQCPRDNSGAASTPPLFPVRDHPFLRIRSWVAWN